MAWFD